jgi:hypothetical protein
MAQAGATAIMRKRVTSQAVEGNRCARRRYLFPHHHQAAGELNRPKSNDLSLHWPIGRRSALRRVRIIARRDGVRLPDLPVTAVYP